MTTVTSPPTGRAVGVVQPVESVLPAGCLPALAIGDHGGHGVRTHPGTDTVRLDGGSFALLLGTGNAVRPAASGVGAVVPGRTRARRPIARGWRPTAAGCLSEVAAGARARTGDLPVHRR